VFRFVSFFVQAQANWLLELELEIVDPLLFLEHLSRACTFVQYHLRTHSCRDRSQVSRDRTASERKEQVKMMKRRRNSATGDMRHGGDPSADAALAKMGYQSELPRNLSMMSVLGLYVPPISPSIPTRRCNNSRRVWFDQQLLPPCGSTKDALYAF
jgi:hypothetical protein